MIGLIGVVVTLTAVEIGHFPLVSHFYQGYVAYENEKIKRKARPLP